MNHETQQQELIPDDTGPVSEAVPLDRLRARLDELQQQGRRILAIDHYGRGVPAHCEVVTHAATPLKGALMKGETAILEGPDGKPYSEVSMDCYGIVRERRI